MGHQRNLGLSRKFTKGPYASYKQDAETETDFYDAVFLVFPRFAVDSKGQCGEG